MLTGSGSKILRHDLKKGSEPEVIYQNENEDQKFTFQYLKNDRLLIFTAEEITVVDLANDNSIIMKMSSSDLQTKKIYDEIDDKIMF